MFKLRRDAHANVRSDERLTDPAAHRSGVDPVMEELPKEAHAAAGQAARPQAEMLTLAVECVCGHTRRDHRGLRIESAGACLECDCHEFRWASQAQESHVEMVETIRAALERVERLQEIVAGLRPHLDGELLEREQSARPAARLLRRGAAAAHERGERAQRRRRGEPRAGRALAERGAAARPPLPSRDDRLDRVAGALRRGARSDARRRGGRGGRGPDPTLEGRVEGPAGRRAHPGAVSGDAGELGARRL